MPGSKVKAKKMAKKCPDFEKFFKEINTRFNGKVSKIYFFDDSDGLNIIFVTKSDKVYSIGSNQSGGCGLGHDKIVDSTHKVEELCKRNIKFITNGENFVTAIDGQDRVLNWGNNSHGELGRGYIGFKSTYMKPEYIKFSVKIDQVSSGNNHSLILTKSGKIFGWGDNSNGQVGYSEKIGKIASCPMPIKLYKDANSKFVQVKCFDCQSFALTNNGRVFRWGKNINSTLGFDIIQDGLIQLPKMMSIMNVDLVEMTQNFSYYLKKRGNICYQGYQPNSSSLSKNPKMLKTNLNFQKIQSFKFYTNNSVVVIVISGKRTFILQDLKLVETMNSDYLSLFFPEIEQDRIKLFYSQINGLKNSSKIRNEIKMKNISIVTEINFTGSNDLSHTNINRKLATSTSSLEQESFIRTRVKRSNSKDFENMEQLMDEKFLSIIPEYQRNSAKMIHIFDDSKSNNILITHSDNKIAYHLFGGKLSHKEINSIHLKSLKISKILSKLNIEKYFNGQDFVFALKNDYRIYGWGRNELAQLGLGHQNNICDEPTLLQDFKAIHLSCGRSHSIALTPDGQLYGWGDNKYGQIGCGKHKGEWVTQPFKLKFFNDQEVVGIYTSFDSSFALTSNNTVYSWGSNDSSQLGLEIEQGLCVYQPKPIDISNVKDVCFSTTNTYFLTNDKFLYYCGKNQDDNISIQKVPIKIPLDIEFEWLRTLKSFKTQCIVATGYSHGRIYRLDHQIPQKTNYISGLSFHLNEYKINDLTIFTENGKLSDKTVSIFHFNQTNSSIMNPNQGNIINCQDFDSLDDLLVVNENDSTDSYQSCASSKKADEQDEINSIKTYNNRIEFEFNDRSIIGSGSFGDVYQAKSSIDGQLYALKKIKFKDTGDKVTTKRMLQEVVFLSQTVSDRIVKYFDSWMEGPTSIYIQMELCTTSFDKILENKLKVFNRERKEPMSFIEYFISCELFKELLGCVQSLHNFRIIHRDLKPQNILVNFPVRNNQYLKICDFGLSKLYDNSSCCHTRNIGSLKYMAPEIMHEVKYNWKVDIYSAGIIAKGIFSMDMDSSGHHKKYRDKLMSYFKSLNEKVNQMIKHPKWTLRPSCDEILDPKNKWACKIKNETFLRQFNSDVNKLKNNKQAIFFKTYFEDKLDFLRW